MKTTFPLLLLCFVLIFPPLTGAETLAPIRVGWIGPLTGNSAVLGIDSVEIMKMVFEKANAEGGIAGRRIELVVEDDQYNTAKTVSAYHKLVHNDRITIIVVITYGGLFAIAPNAERDGVLLLDPLDCDEAIAALPSNTLCIAKMTEDLAHSITEYVVKQKELPLGVLYYGGDAFPVNMQRETEKKFRELGISEYYIADYNDSTADFRSTLTSFKNKKIKSLAFYGYDQLGTAMYQARSLGMDVPFYSVATVTSPGFAAAAKGAENGTRTVVWFAPRTPAYAQYVAEFTARKGRAPFFDISNVPSFDIATILVEKLKSGAIRPADDGVLPMPSAKNTFYGLKNYQGLSGNITVDADGGVRSFERVKMKVFRGGQFEEIPVSKVEPQ